MKVSMDISDLNDDDQEVIRTLARQFEESFEEVVEKNRDYSWSFLQTGKDMAESSAIPIDSVTRSNVLTLLTRISDKRNRLEENVFGDGSSVVSDEPSVTAQEMSNYLQFVAFVLANPDLAETVGE